MEKKFQIFAWIFFAVVVTGSLVYAFTVNSSDSNSNVTAQKVHILKYSDYQCPACKLYIPLQNQLVAEFGDMVEFEYRHFPLSGFQYSRLAAHSVEAAGMQGKSKEMHDLIFENQELWSLGNAQQYFERFAEQIGLDMDRFREDVNSDEVRQIVESQKREGERRMVSSTPTFFINGVRLRQNPQNYEQFRSIVELYMYRSN